jgi:hypothetical protein
MIGLAVAAAHLVLIPYTWCSTNPGESCAASWRRNEPGLI